MAIQVQTVGATDLRLASAILKTNWSSARPSGPLAGLTVGYWQSFFLRMPANTAGVAPFLAGWDGGNTNNFTAGNDCYDAFGGNNVSLGARQNRPQWRARHGGTTDAFGGTAGAEMLASIVLDQTPPTTAAIIIKGVSYLEHLGTPNWYGWMAVCRLDTGAVSSYVAPTPVAAAWISSTSAALGHQIFHARGTGNTRTLANTALEQFAIAQGDFPWDTANDGNGAVGTGRPHHDAIRALAGVGSNPFLTYSDLAAAQAAGALPYANCVQGRSDIAHHWTLRDLSTGLTNNGSAGTVTLLATDHTGSGGLVNGSDLAPAHWYGGAPTIIEPTIKFVGGIGAAATVVSGTRTAGANTQRRWERMSDSSAVAGFDWTDIATQSGTTWTTSDVLPAGGPYRLRVRDAATPALASNSDDWLVGAIALGHGQSGMELGFYNGNVPGVNNLNLAVAAGAQGIFLKLNNQGGGTAATYARPTPNVVRLIGGQTPACGSGAVAAINQWQADNPGVPLLIAPMAINGTAMVDWANNATAENAGTVGHASWKFMGTIGALPDAGSGNNSGVVEFHAALLGRRVDCHMMMWNPNISTDPAVRALYLQGVRDRFSATPNAPWMMLPPWRVHRDPGDRAGSVTVRQDHLDFRAQIEALGIPAAEGPCWLDIVNDSNGPTNGGHSAWRATAGVEGVDIQPVSDGNRVGQSRVGASIGRALAWFFNRTIKGNTMRLLAAWWVDPVARNQIMIDTGRQMRTLGGASLLNLFWISEAGGAWGNSGFTAALVTEGGRNYVRLTKDSGAWNATTRVDYGRTFAGNPAVNASEMNSERILDGLLYDDQRHRGGINFTGNEAGNPLQGTNIVSTTSGGIPVQARGPAKLVATERWTGTRNVTVRMMAADGVTVLRERTIAVTGS